MQASLRLLTKRNFLPLFVTQFLGAFNDNLFKTAMILFATYVVFKDPPLPPAFSSCPSFCCRRCPASWRTIWTRRRSSGS
jgi:hypothetical protein